MRNYVFPSKGKAMFTFLKNEGVEELLDAVSYLAMDKVYPEAFGAMVFRISNDKEGNRLTHVKVTGGVLEAKQKIEEEKVDQENMLP